MIVGITLSKKLADTYGKRDVFMAALFISTLFIVVFYFFAATSVGLMFSAQIVHGFFYGLTIPLLWAMIADVAELFRMENQQKEPPP